MAQRLRELEDERVNLEPVEAGDDALLLQAPDFEINDDIEIDGKYGYAAITIRGLGEIFGDAQEAFLRNDQSPEVIQKLRQVARICEACAGDEFIGTILLKKALSFATRSSEFAEA